MSRHSKYSTSPGSVLYACQHGISENPLYMQCDRCGVVNCPVLRRMEEEKIGRDNARRLGEIIRKAQSEPNELWGYPPDSEGQWLHYWGHVIGNSEKYPPILDCIYNEPRDENGHLTCHKCPLVGKVYCYKGIAEMNNRDVHIRCKEKFENREAGWQDIYVNPKTGYWCDFPDRPKTPEEIKADQWREIRIGMMVWAVIIFLAWLSS